MATRDQIVNSIIELKNKSTDTVIPIIKRELVFESSKYSSTKETIWHVFINGIKVKKTSDYIFTYECLYCHNVSSCASTQILRKIRQCKPKCFICTNIQLNSIEHPKKIHIEKEIKSFKEVYEESKKEFDTYPEQYRNSYFLAHLTVEDYNRIKKNILSFGNGKYNTLDEYEYWSIYKVNNQMRFSYVLYNKTNDTIFKAHQPILRCDNCEKTWRCKSLELFKNCYKILCPDCKLCNRTFKIRTTKNCNNDVIMYQSKLELKFIDWCASNNMLVKNGPNVDYEFNNKQRKYRVDFQIGDNLIEIKDFHIWHRNQVESGMWKEKVDAVNNYIVINNLKKYYFITPNNWNQMTTELKTTLNKI